LCLVGLEHGGIDADPLARLALPAFRPVKENALAPIAKIKPPRKLLPTERARG
jgi:hypothetical protein